MKNIRAIAKQNKELIRKYKNVYLKAIKYQKWKYLGEGVLGCPICHAETIVKCQELGVANGDCTDFCLWLILEGINCKDWLEKFDMSEDFNKPSPKLAAKRLEMLDEWEKVIHEIIEEEQA